jgi:hypothetical protein
MSDITGLGGCDVRGGDSSCAEVASRGKGEGDSNDVGSGSGDMLETGDSSRTLPSIIPE